MSPLTKGFSHSEKEKKEKWSLSDFQLHQCGGESAGTTKFYRSVVELRGRSAGRCFLQFEFFLGTNESRCISRRMVPTTTTQRLAIPYHGVNELYICIGK